MATRLSITSKVSLEEENMHYVRSPIKKGKLYWVDTENPYKLQPEEMASVSVLNWTDNREITMKNGDQLLKDRME